MGIVRFALALYYTFSVLAMLILFLGFTAFRVMPTDIFPEIDIPVVTVIWQYTGLDTPEMKQRVTTDSQYAISTSANGIKDIEAQTLNGISVQRIYFQPDVRLDVAIAQIVSATNFIRVLLPAGHPGAARRSVQCPQPSRYCRSASARTPSASSSSTSTATIICDSGWPDPRRHFSDTSRRQIPPVHGRSRPGETVGQESDPTGYGECRQCPEPDLAVGHRENRRHAGRGHSAGRSRGWQQSTDSFDPTPS